MSETFLKQLEDLSVIEYPEDQAFTHPESFPAIGPRFFRFDRIRFHAQCPLGLCSSSFWASPRMLLHARIVFWYLCVSL